MFRYKLEAELEGQERRRPEGREYWAKVKEWEGQSGKQFGEIVHELSVSHPPAEVANRLGISRHFLYQHFAWAMDKIASLERSYSMPLGQLVRRRREDGVSMNAMAKEWGLADTTLYNAQRGSKQLSTTGAE